MRVAFFGGTFDPIHRGHLGLAAAAADAFALDRVLFAPVGQQPLKAAPAIASFADRLAMATLACNPEPASAPSLLSSRSEGGVPGERFLLAGVQAEGSASPRTNPDPRFAVSTLDAPRADGAPNYTIDSLAALARELPTASLYVLTGADSFLDLRRWRSPDRLLALAEWIVVSRPDFPLSEAQIAPLDLTPAQRARVHLLTTLNEEVSATNLRRRLQAGDPCPGLLPPAVASYILSHHLYR